LFETRYTFGTRLHAPFAETRAAVEAAEARAAEAASLSDPVVIPRRLNPMNRPSSRRRR